MIFSARSSAIAMVALVMAACSPETEEAVVIPEGQEASTMAAGAQAEAPGVVEIVTFRLNPGVTEEQFFAANRTAQEGYVARQPGFISREVYRGENGEWLFVVEWQTPANAEAASTGFGAAPETQELLPLLDMTSMVGKAYARP